MWGDVSTYKLCSKRLVTLILSLCFISLNIKASDFEVVYGDDERVDVDKSLSPAELTFSSAVLMMVDSERLTLDEKSNSYALKVQDYSKFICKGERFYDQKKLGRCSGFLVGKDLLVTAGHCMRSESDCKNFKWVLDYRVDTVDFTNESPKLSADLVVGCKEVVEKKFNFLSKEDYALVRLDRKLDRPYHSFRKSGMANENKKMFMLGHPAGLPMKLTQNISVRKNNKDDPFFVVEADSFGGNSGSPIFDQETGLVEGILVRGESDYVYDDVEECYRVKVCESGTCRGEDVTRITSIQSIKETVEDDVL